MNTLTFDADGLIPAVVQDVETGSVLMVAYMNGASLRLTRETGFVHFWSRSRQELWMKGATSGSKLLFESISPDCDSDAVLVLARPAGPTCHTGSASCFGDLRPSGTLEALAATIRDRIDSRPEGSYTAQLAEGGPETVGRKLVEEATEVLLAAKDHQAGFADERRLAEEAADLLYHLMVALAERDVPLDAVYQVLDDRRAASAGR